MKLQRAYQGCGVAVSIRKFDFPDAVGGELQSRASKDGEFDFGSHLILHAPTLAPGFPARHKGLGLPILQDLR